MRSRSLLLALLLSLPASAGRVPVDKEIEARLEQGEWEWAMKDYRDKDLPEKYRPRAIQVHQEYVLLRIAEVPELTDLAAYCQVRQDIDPALRFLRKVEAEPPEAYEAWHSAMRKASKEQLRELYATMGFQEFHDAASTCRSTEDSRLSLSANSLQVGVHTALRDEAEELGYPHAVMFQQDLLRNLVINLEARPAPKRQPREKPLVVVRMDTSALRFEGCSQAEIDAVRAMPSVSGGTWAPPSGAVVYRPKATGTIRCTDKVSEHTDITPGKTITRTEDEGTVYEERCWIEHDIDGGYVDVVDFRGDAVDFTYVITSEIREVCGSVAVGRDVRTVTEVIPDKVSVEARRTRRADATITATLGALSIEAGVYATDSKSNFGTEPGLAPPPPSAMNTGSEIVHDLKGIAAWFLPRVRPPYEAPEAERVGPRFTPDETRELHRRLKTATEPDLEVEEWFVARMHQSPDNTWHEPDDVNAYLARVYRCTFGDCAPHNLRYTPEERARKKEIWESRKKQR